MKTFSIFLAATVLSISSFTFTRAAEESAAEKQRKFIAILQSDAPAAEKAIPCKQLAIYGTKEAVPALAPLLANKDLASWARIALEAIPGPEADEALRSALPKLEGSLLIGTINSIGVRRDAKAVEALAGNLSNPNRQIAAAAAAALGNIGGAQAARTLSQSLSKAGKDDLSFLAEGMIVCAERFLDDSKFAEATRLYDAVRNKADMPLQRRLEATRGAILARQSDGLPLLMEQLRSTEKTELGMALRTARELKGRNVTEAIGAEMESAASDRQVMLLLALSDRKDEAVLPRLLKAAEKSSKPARIAALALLDRYGDLSTIPVLLSAAADADAEIARPAKATLTRMEGKQVDAALLERLPQSAGKTRQVIIELAALRRIEAAVPAMLSSATDSDAGVRRAALGTLSTLGSDQHVEPLAQLLTQKSDARDREAIERALSAICGRAGAKCAPQIIPLSKNGDPELRAASLRILATVGGPDALGAVSAGVNDADENVRDEAVGILATWPNNWPEDSNVAEPLLNLVKSGRKPAHKIQGVRGYLLHLQENKKLNHSDKVSAIERLLPNLQQAQEKRLAISTLGNIPTGKSIEMVIGLAEDPEIAEEASLTLVNLATAKELKDAPKDLRQRALQIAQEKSKNDATKKKAADAAKSIQ